MKIIPTIIENVTSMEDGLPVVNPVARPAEPFPADTIKVISGPDGYTVYQEGDVIP